MLRELKLLIVSRIEFIRSKLSNFSAHVSGVTGRPCGASRVISFISGHHEDPHRTGPSIARVEQDRVSVSPPVRRYVLMSVKLASTSIRGQLLQGPVGLCARLLSDQTSQGAGEMEQKLITRY